MTRRPILAVLAAAALVPAACGDDTAATPKPTAAAPVASAVKDPPAHTRGENGKTACQAVRAADVRPILVAAGARARVKLRREARTSDGLSDCRYHARGVAAWVTIDRATDASRRYGNRIEEQVEFQSFPGAAGPPQLVRGVGQDRTYGGGGAFWTPSLNRLLAYRDATMLVVGFSVKGSTDRQRRIGATKLAKLTYKRLFGNRKPRAEHRVPHSTGP